MGGEKIQHTRRLWQGKGRPAVLGAWGAKEVFTAPSLSTFQCCSKVILGPTSSLTTVCGPSALFHHSECLPCPFFLHTLTTALYASVCVSPRKKAP